MTWLIRTTALAPCLQKTSSIRSTWGQKCAAQLLQPYGSIHIFRHVTIFRTHCTLQYLRGSLRYSKELCKYNSDTIRKPVWILKRIFTTSCRRSNNGASTNKVKLSLNNATQSTTVKKAKLPKFAEVRRLLGLARPEKWPLTGAVSCLIVSSLVTLSVPFFIGKIIDLIYTTEKDHIRHRLNQVCGSLIVLFLIGGLANFGRAYILHTSGQRMVKRLRQTLFTKIIRQDIGFFDKTKTGELVNRLSSDTIVVTQSLSQNISDGLRACFQATAGLGMMLYVSSKLTMISMGIVPPVAIGSIIYGRYLRKITKKVQDSLAEATHVAEERIATIRTVRAFAHENKECKVYDKEIQRVLDLSYKEALARGAFWGFAGFSGNVIIISVFYFGGCMMLESNITVGDLSSFLLYAAYVGASLGGITSFLTELNRGIAASQRIWYLIDKKAEIESDHGKKPPLLAENIEGNIQFRNVSFTYPTRDDMQIFSNLSFDIPSGSVTAIVGPSGSGKSTLGSLLLRFYDPNTGCVCLDGKDIRDYDPCSLRSRIGAVSQEPILFSTTIGENIAYGSETPENVTMEEIFDAARKANAYNFVSNFPNGFDTLVGERGTMLSGGQRQRIAIARAILKNPKILILDEATSALDAESEYLVQDALEKLMVGRTVLTIAHRLSTIKSANKIVAIDQGRVVESGTYQELMALENGLFRRLILSTLFAPIYACVLWGMWVSEFVETQGELPTLPRPDMVTTKGRDNLQFKEIERPEKNLT